MLRLFAHAIAFLARDLSTCCELLFAIFSGLLFNSSPKQLFRGITGPANRTRHKAATAPLLRREQNRFSRFTANIRIDGRLLSTSSTVCAFVTVNCILNDTIAYRSWTKDELGRACSSHFSFLVSFFPCYFLRAISSISRFFSQYSPFLSVFLAVTD